LIEKRFLNPQIVFGRKKITRAYVVAAEFGRTAKGKDPGTYCNDACMSQTRNQKSFTILEVVDDWHEPTVRQRILRPSNARTSRQLDPRYSQQTYHRPTPPQYIGIHPIA